MTSSQENARSELTQAVSAISLCAELLKSHLDLFERYAAEAEHMDSVGPIIDPTLFRNPERRAADAVVRPLFRAAQDFLRAIDEQKSRARVAIDQVTA